MPKPPPPPSALDTLSGGLSIPPRSVPPLPAGPVSLDGETPVEQRRAPTRVPTLRVVAGRDVLRFVTLPPGAMKMVGRDPDCDLPLTEPTVSRHHVVVTAADDGTVTIEDQNAMNGTRVNGVAVTRARMLPGEQLELGTAMLRLEALTPEELAHLGEVVRRLDAAEHDPMTGLLFDDWLDQELASEVERAGESLSPLSVVIIALDDPRGLREIHGAKVADDVVRVFSRLVLLSVRDSDACVRRGTGGAVVLVHADAVAAHKVAERMLGTLREHPWERVHRRVRVSASAGVATLRPGEPPEIWLERAAAALQRAARHGLSAVELDDGSAS